MAIERHLTTDNEHQVLKFRPRTSARAPAAAPRDSGNDPGEVVPDLSEYGRGREPPDEYRHRMIANVLAIAFTTALTGAGIWLAITLADLRNTQDCILMGRRDCAHISAQKSDLIRHN